MIRFKFDVLAESIPTVSDLAVGDAVIPVAQRRIDLGGYEYDTWKRLKDGLNVDVRIEHRPKFESHVIECESEDEIIQKVEEICEKVRANG